MEYSNVILALILITTLLGCFGDREDFLARQRRLAEEQLRNQEADDPYLEKPQEESPETSYHYSESDNEILDHEIADPYQNVDPYASTPLEDPTVENVQEEAPYVDEKVNPYKTFKGYYEDPDKSKTIKKPSGEDYRTVQFIKDIIMQFNCFQKGYIIEDGEVWTEEEMAKILAEQAALEPKDDFEEFFLEDDPNRPDLNKNLTSNVSVEVPQVPLGPDCTKLLCGSCKVVLDEFGKALMRNAKEQKIKYMKEVAEEFCSVKEINLKYIPFVRHVCKLMLERHRDFILDFFERDANWNANTENVPFIHNKKKDICLSLGFCSEDNYKYQNKPENHKQEHWTPDCFVCRAMGSEIEERVVLTTVVTEPLAETIVNEVCDNIKLPSQEDGICRKLVSEKRSDMAWISKLHAETIWKRKTSPDMMFPERMCCDVGFCEKWVDPEEKLKKEVELEAVFW